MTLNLQGHAAVDTDGVSAEATDVAQLKADVAHLKIDVAQIKVRVEQFATKAELIEVETRLKTGMVGMAISIITVTSGIQFALYSALAR